MKNTSLTVAQEHVATEEAIEELRKAAKRRYILHMEPGEAELVLERIARLQMLADAYRRVSRAHESMVSDLLKLLENDDMDGARDIVKAEYDAIHGPND